MSVRCCFLLRTIFLVVQHVKQKNSELSATGLALFVHQLDSRFRFFIPLRQFSYDRIPDMLANADAVRFGGAGEILLIILVPGIAESFAGDLFALVQMFLIAVALAFEFCCFGRVVFRR